MELHKEPRFEKPVTTIGIGDVLATDRDVMVSTLLGSCVSVVLWDARLAVGGMAHFLAPEPPQRPEGTPAPGRYGTTAIPLLLEKMAAFGCRPGTLSAKVFGGASLLLGGEAGVYTVGPRNIRVAMDLLEGLGIPVVRTSVGGHFGRKIYLEARTFVVYVRRLARPRTGES